MDFFQDAIDSMEEKNERKTVIESEIKGEMGDHLPTSLWGLKKWTIRHFYTLALKHKSKINPFGALCQCNWETRTNGRPWESELFKRANNAAGIKSGVGWHGDIYEKVSWEQRPDGTRYDKKSAFRKYISVDDFWTIMLQR